MTTKKASDSGATSSPSWQPLSARRGGPRIDTTWQEGIPPWIDRAVRDWLETQLTGRTRNRLFARIHFTHKVEFGDSPVTDLTGDELLDWLDGVLHIEAESSHAEHNAKILETILREGHSIWKVSDNFDELERRQDATVTAAAHSADKTAQSNGFPAASFHLREAWSATYGLHSEPAKAFRESILAVEAVAVPVITPRHLSAQLGDVYGQLRTQGHLYELAALDKTTSKPASIDPVTNLIGLLWHGHTDRHEGNVPAIPITQDAAEIAVHTAALLVQWFSSGAVKRSIP